LPKNPMAKYGAGVKWRPANYIQCVSRLRENTGHFACRKTLAGTRNTDFEIREGHLWKYGTVGHSMLGLVNTCVSKEVSK